MAKLFGVEWETRPDGEHLWEFEYGLAYLVERPDAAPRPRRRPTGWETGQYEFDSGEGSRFQIQLTVRHECGNVEVSTGANTLRGVLGKMGALARDMLRELPRKRKRTRKRRRGGTGELE